MFGATAMRVFGPAASRIVSGGCKPAANRPGGVMLVGKDGHGYTPRVAVDWTDEERKKVEDGIARHGIRTCRCAALARIVHPVAQQRDPKARAICMRPPKGATWLVPKDSDIPYWKGHVYVETRGHAIDAVTGSKGYSPASMYVEDHWEFADVMRVEEVDPATVDPGIQDLEDES